METREIPRDSWSEYLVALSDLEREHPVRIEVDATELGEQVVTEGMSLLEMSVDMKGTGSPAIEVTLGRDGMPPALMHRIHQPEHLYVQEDGGKIEALSIEDRSKARTIISFLH